MKAKMLAVFGCVGVLITVLSIPCQAEIGINRNGEIIESNGAGSINWTTRRVEATGCAEKDQSFFKQRVAAEVVARTNLLKLLGEVKIESERIVRDGLLRGEISIEKVQGLLRYARVTEPRTNSQGLLEVTAYVYLDQAGNSLLSPVVERPWVSGVPAPEDAPPKSEIATKQVVYSGLIIDATGLSLRPAMMPKLLVEGSDMELFNPKEYDQQKYDEQGFCGYTGSLEKAIQAVDRVGAFPLVAKAAGVSSNRIDLILKKEDAGEVMKAEREGRVLSQGRVMVILNQFPTGRPQ